MYLTILQRKGPSVKFFLSLRHLRLNSLFMNWFIFTGIGLRRTVLSHPARCNSVGLNLEAAQQQPLPFLTSLLQLLHPPRLLLGSGIFGPLI